MRPAATPFHAPLAALIAALAFTSAPRPARADEGMWTFNDFPTDRVEKAYGFRPDQAWLDHVRLVLAAACPRLLGELRLAHGPGADQPSLRAGLHPAAFHRDRGSRRHRILRQGGEGRAQMLQCRGQPARRHHRCHRPGQRGDRRQGRQGTRRRPQGGRGGDRARVLGRRQPISAATSSSFIMAASTIFTVTAAIRTCGSSSRPKWRSRSSAATRTISSFPRYDLDVTYLRVYADDRPLDSAANYPALRQDRRAARRPHLHVRPSRPHRPARHRRRPRIPARRDAAAHPVRGFRVARHPDRILRTAAPNRRASPRACCSASRIRSRPARAALPRWSIPPSSRQARAFEQALRGKVEADPQLSEETGPAWDNIRDTLDAYRGMRDRYAFTEGGQGFRSRLSGLPRRWCAAPPR